MDDSLKEISIILDVWDDIFSDFDPRPLDERTLSQDFLNELMKRYTEKKRGKLLISFYLPAALKDEQSEKMVNHRLKRYFKARALQKKHDIYQMRLRGVIFVLIGFVSLSSITVISYFRLIGGFVDQLLEILLVPLGWFGMWEGLLQIVNVSPALAQEEQLYGKLADAEYRFHYEA